MRKVGKVLSIGGLTYAVVCLGVYIGMLQPPAAFSRAAATVPTGWMFTTLPVETMWKFARAGKLRPGDPAPDFRLPLVNQTGEVTLSSHRGVRPVFLVFGSYT